jgi:hypothetical protein
MPEGKHQDDEVRVVDRRRFTTEGERREGVEEPAPAPPVAPSPVVAAASPAAPPVAESANRDARQAYERQAGAAPNSISKLIALSPAPPCCSWA